MDPTPDRAAAFLRQKYFDSLDGLRALSIVAVVWHHTAKGPGLLGRGYLGVNFFFAISGFLITSLLVRERARRGRVDLPAFYVRRTLRIFPLYYIVLGVYVAIALTIERGSAAGQTFLSNLPWFASYTSNWFGGSWVPGTRIMFYFAWSLATEEQFYLVWPWFIRYTRGALAPAAWMTALLGTAVLAPSLLGAYPTAARMLGSISPAICLGCLGAIAAHRPAGFAWLDAVLGKAWSLPALLALIAAALAWDGTPELLIEALMAAFVVTTCIRPRHVLRPLLENRLARHVGTVSYGMYLMHMLVIGAVRRALPGLSGRATFVVALPVIVAVATLSHRTVERGFLSLRSRVGEALRQAPAPAASP
jgi:peptidoglycan/LPS O-acetylase OafA/YrhL